MILGLYWRGRAPDQQDTTPEEWAWEDQDGECMYPGPRDYGLLCGGGGQSEDVREGGLLSEYVSGEEWLLGVFHQQGHCTSR